MTEKQEALSISLEELISSMQISKEQREQLYTDIIKESMQDSNPTVLWEDDKIVGFKTSKSAKVITITLDYSTEDTDAY